MTIILEVDMLTTFCSTVLSSIPGRPADCRPSPAGVRAKRLCIGLEHRSLGIGMVVLCRHTCIL